MDGREKSFWVEGGGGERSLREHGTTTPGKESSKNNRKKKKRWGKEGDVRSVHNGEGGRRE